MDINYQNTLLIKENEDLKSEIEKLNDLVSSLVEIKKKYKKKIVSLEKFSPKKDKEFIISDEFKNINSGAAIQKVLCDYEFNKVLDVGAGALSHSKIFSEKGKDVTAVDFGNSVYYGSTKNEIHSNISRIIGDFNQIRFDAEYDLVWVSHVLEHQLDVNDFLKKIISAAKDGGIIAITVPPLKHQIVGGHVSLWNAGLILYRLVICGVNCKNASILSYGYNISVIVRKDLIEVDDLQYDAGDLRRIKKYLPDGLDFLSNAIDDPFDGNISRLNWV